MAGILTPLQEAVQTFKREPSGHIEITEDQQDISWGDYVKARDEVLKLATERGLAVRFDYIATPPRGEDPTTILDWA